MLAVEALALNDLARGRRGTVEPYRRAGSNGVVLFEVKGAQMDFTKLGGFVASGRYDRFGSEAGMPHISTLISSVSRSYQRMSVP